MGRPIGGRFVHRKRASSFVHVICAAATMVVAGCGGGGDSGGTGPVPNNSVASVVLQPTTVTLNTIGATSQLAAEARTSSGSPVSGQSFTWTSSNSAVASVSSSGLVTAAANGSATITATVIGSAASGSAQVTVQAVVPFSVTRDTSISGTVTSASINIPAGVTVTASGPLTMRSSGLVSIAGTVRSSCGAMDIQGDTAVTVTGTVANGCDQPGNPGALRLAARGELRLDGATIVSSGDIKLTNNPSLAFSGASSGVAAAGAGVPFTFVGNSTIRFHGGSTGPNPAAPGTDGVNGTAPPNEARSVELKLDGNAIFAGNTLLWGQDGGRGGRGTNSATTDLTVTAGKGGTGGTIKIDVSGKLTYQGAGNVVRAGSGGAGGTATATAMPNAALTGKAPSATATAGDGGESGVVDIRAGGGVEILTPGALVVQTRPGIGGDATATGALGADALAIASNPAQEGGNGSATAGKGGSTPDTRIVTTVTGAPVFEVDASKGGDATASAGNGGNGLKPQKDGAKGGNMTATGGSGGNARLRNHLNSAIGNGGNGGKSFYRGGNGGSGWSDCRDGSAPEPGGVGGKGGTAAGSQGPGGLGGAGFVNGSDGNTHFENVGNGGNGGAGDPAGTRGLAGADNVNPKGAPVRLAPTFTDGQAGQTCRPAELLRVVIPASMPLGVVTLGLYIADLVDAQNVKRGTVVLEAGGTPGNTFHQLNPDRLGYRMTDGWWKINWGTALVDGVAVCGAQAASTTTAAALGWCIGPKSMDVCLTNGIVTSLNRVDVLMRSRTGVVIATLGMVALGCFSGLPIPEGTHDTQFWKSGAGPTIDLHGLRVLILWKVSGLIDLRSDQTISGQRDGMRVTR